MVAIKTSQASTRDQCLRCDEYVIGIAVVLEPLPFYGRFFYLELRSGNKQISPSVKLEG